MSKITKRSDGRYCVQILIGYQPDGRRKMKTIYGKTKRELEIKEREFRGKLENGLKIDDENISLEEWGKRWLKVYKAKVSKNTYSMYENSLKNHIFPTIGNIQLAKLKPIHIQEEINNLISHNNFRTAEIFKLTIKQIIEQAVEEGIISKNICTKLDKIRSNSTEKRTLTDFELQCISKTKYTDRERLFLSILYYTGIRRGEALALTIWDIDKTERLLNINKSLDISDNTPEIKEPKTRAGNRQIPIPDALYTLLIENITKNKTSYLFTMKNGELMTRSSYRKMWNSIIKKTQKTAQQLKETYPEYSKNLNCCDITFTPHIFRHTYATNLYYAKIDIKRTQYLMGHSSTEMTLKTYTHLDNLSSSNTVSETLNNFFSQSKISQTEFLAG